MSDDVTPSQAIREVGDGDDGGSVPEASSDEVSEATASHEAAEGAESSGRFGSRSALQDALMSSEPERPLRAIESPWNPEEGGVTRIYRGIQKMSGFDGMPAIGDIIIGAVEAFQNFEPDGGGGEEDDGGEQAADERDVPDLADVGDSEEGMAV